MKYPDLSLGQVEAIVNKLGGMEGAMSFLRDERVLQEKQTSRSSFSIHIDYSQSLADMITAGKYDWKNDDITEKRFPLKGEGSIEHTVHLLHYDRVMRSDDVITQMDADGFVPALIEDLLAFGAQHPEEQRKYPIIALGSSAKVHGDRGFPFLDRRGSKRNLYLLWFDIEWYEQCRFLARNKVSAT